MAKTFKVGDHVTWNSEAGWVSGRIVRVHTSDVNYKGYVHHASEGDPQYEIKSTRPITSLCTKVGHCGCFAADRQIPIGGASRMANDLCSHDAPKWLRLATLRQP